ncbi:MAG: hypothetical protein QM644_10325 [Mobilitalea sp.]
MIKRMNALFFGSCLLAAILLEVYCIQVFDGELISAIGIGIVVLITGYLFMDSIRSIYKESFEKSKQLLQELQRDEIAKRDSQYEELLNLQKASYTAVKKSEALLTKQMEEVFKRIDNLESSNDGYVNKIIELQKKMLEGQKNALNLEIKYNKENTKEIIDELQNKHDYEVLMEQVTELKILIEKNIEDTGKKIVTGFQEDDYETYLSSKGMLDQTITSDMELYEEDNIYENEEDGVDRLVNKNEDEESLILEDTTEGEEDYEFSDVSELEKTSDSDLVSEESASEENTNTKEENPVASNIVPLYDDPNKALTADEIAALFASLG